MLALAAGTTPARAADPEREPFDAGQGATAAVPSDVTEAREDLRDDLGDQGLLTVDKSTGAVHFLARLDGFLDASPSSDPVAAVRDYLRRRADAFGIDPADVGDLRLADRESAGGIQTLEFAQKVDGVPVVGSSVQASLDPRGRLIAITGGPVPDSSLDTTHPDLSAEGARAAAAAGVARPGAAGRPTLAAYQSAEELRLAWRVLVSASSTAVYDTLVDAMTGKVVRRANLVAFASARAFDNYPGAATGGTSSLHSLGATSQSPAGYLTLGAGELIGPNAHAFADPEDVVPGSDLNNPVQDPGASGETPPTSGDDFDYAFNPWSPSPGDQYSENCLDASFVCSWDPKNPDWSANSNQAATQLFWYVNLFHDHLKAGPIGFGQASGNFEGADRVIAQAQDGANTNPVLGVPDTDHSNNANMLVLPDGTPGFMQMYLWDPVNDVDPGRDYRPVDGGDDPSLVFHEYSHGLIHRLVTDAQGYGALDGAQAGAIDEGTADWYSLDYLVGDGTNPYIPDATGTPDVTLGRYTVAGPTGTLTGLRTQAIDCKVGSGPEGSGSTACPDAGGGAGAGGYSYGDFGKVVGGAEVHADGEIWGQTLWQLRQALIDTHGAADGIARARRLVTNALRLVPADPTFLDMRNAILLADNQQGINGGDRALIWDVFASRGMGYAASTRGTDDVQPVQDFTPLPSPTTPVGSMAGIVRDQDTGAPLAGVLVAFSGHDSGLGEDLSTHTASNGTYRIDGVPSGRTWDYVAIGPAAGYDRTLVEDVPISANSTLTRNFTLHRNWALASGGTQVKSFTGGNFSSYGCGPGSAIDGTRRTVWSARSPANSADLGAKQLVITLPQSITLGSVRIDPSSGCGDPSDAGLGGYRVAVSSDGVTFGTVAQGTFTSANNGKTNPVSLTSQPSKVRYVRLTALSTQGSSCARPAPIGTTQCYVDVAELQVFAKAPQKTIVIPPTTTTSQTPPPPPKAVLRVLTSRSKLTRHRTFVWKLSGPKGALARARFTVVVGRGSHAHVITLARAKFRLSEVTGRARVVVHVSRRTLRRIHKRKLRVGVAVRAGGLRATSKLSLTRPRVSRR